jgi:tetratricopeptide (TPR) repeat protein
MPQILPGLACIGLGNYEDALQYLNRALSLSVSQDNLAAQSIHLGNLGLLYGEIGDYPRAIEMHKRSLGISREVADRRGEGRDIGNWG